MEKKINYKEAIQKWLQTEPTEADLKQVYDVTFRREIAKLKKEKRSLESKLKKYNKIKDDLTEIKQKPWDSMEEEMKSLEKKIIFITNEVSKYEQPKKEAKNEKEKKAA